MISSSSTLSSKELPLLMLPGMMCDARLFGPQIDHCAWARTVTVGDLGTSDSIATLAQQQLQQAPARFALAGLSMGGIVAMEMLCQAPERIAGIALMDTNPLAELPEVSLARESQIQKALAGGLAAVMRDEMKPRYLANGDNKMAILNLCMAMALDLGTDVFVKQSRALQNHRDQQECLRNAAIPALVLMGQEDTLCPRDRHQLMADLLPQSELVIVQNAGHLPTLEQPHATNMALTQWLSRL